MLCFMQPWAPRGWALVINYLWSCQPYNSFGTYIIVPSSYLEKKKSFTSLRLWNWLRNGTLDMISDRAFYMSCVCWFLFLFFWGAVSEWCGMMLQISSSKKKTWLVNLTSRECLVLEKSKAAGCDAASYTGIYTPAVLFYTCLVQHLFSVFYNFSVTFHFAF